MLISRTAPFRSIHELQRAMEEGARRGSPMGYTARESAFPPINLFRKGDDFVAVVELPGIDKSKLDIQARNNFIRISGEKSGNDPEGMGTRRRERLFGTFDRTIRVPVRVDADGIKAEYRDGILALFIPQAEEDKPRKVRIN